jgi:PTS system nitrogen regulatory IIA component
MEELLDREKSYSTGLECGIAVPHAMVEGVEKTVCLVATMQVPVNMGTVDGSLVHTAFLLLSPPEAVATHIRLLARIARLCSETAFVERLRRSPDAETLYRTIVEEDERHV